MGSLQSPDPGARADSVPARRREWLAAGAALLLFVVAGTGLVHRALFGDQVLSAATQLARTGPFPEALAARAPPDNPDLSDSNVCCVPWLRFAADAFAADGRLPLWKDTAGTGAPFIGNSQAALFFPTNLLAIVAGAPPVALALIALAKLVAGAWGAWLLARHLQLSHRAALLCGLVFGFCGFQVGWLLFPLSNVSLLLPLLVLAADRLVLRPSAARLLLLAAVAGLQHLGGHPETAFHAQVAVALLGCARLASLRARLPRGACWRRLLWLAGGFVLGALLAAIQVLPLVEYLGHSAALASRSAGWLPKTVVDPLAAAGFGLALLVALLALRRLATTSGRLLPPALLLAGSTCIGVVLGLKSGMSPTFVLAVAPDWFGVPTNYSGPGAHVEWTGAFAGAALPLAMLGLLRAPQRGVARAAGVALAVGLLAGFEAPLVHDLLAALPIFGLAVNTRLLMLALLATAVLAGFGLDALGSGLAQAKERARLACCVIAPLAAAFAGLMAGVQLGLVPASDIPARPEGSALMQARLLSHDEVASVFPEAPPSAGAGPVRWFSGFFVSATEPAKVRVLYGRALDSVVAQWKAAPVSSPSTWVFRAAVPESELLPGQAIVRVLVNDARGASAVSGWLVSPDDAAPLLPFPARPASAAGLTPLALLLLVLGVLLLPPGGVRARHLRWAALLLLVALSLLPFAQGAIPLLPRELFYPASPLIDVLRGARPEGRSVCTLSSVLGPEIPSFYGLADVRSYDGIGPAHATTLANAALGRGQRESPEAGEAAPAPDLTLLGLLGVKLVLQPGPAPATAADATAHPAWNSRRFHVEANPFFLPRARLVGGAIVQADDERALDALRDAAFPRERCLVLAAGTPADAPAGSIGSARIVSSRPEQVRVEIAPEAPGWLLLADTDYPGWKALVDGRPRDIVRANVAMRAVAVRPGDRLVEFRYEPLSYRAGGIVSLGTAVLLLGACLAGAVVRRRRAAAAVAAAE